MDGSKKMILTLLALMVVSFVITIAVMPLVIKKLKDAEITGIDVNKIEKPKIVEMGGLGAIFGVSVAFLIIAIVFGRNPILAVFGVLLIAAFIGIVDDVKGISRRMKAVYVAAASIPLIIVQPGLPVILLPFHYLIELSGIPFFYWLVLVPIGVTGAANALNMSAGYNGLESGEFAVISFFLLIISCITNPDSTATLVFSVLLGASIALFIFNKYPAKMFVGNVGTLGMGATIAAGVIIGNIEFFGILCILPAFYELFATIYYGNVKKIERRDACMNPVILKDNKLKPPKGSERFTLAYLLLSKKPMHEKKLVGVILSIYVICGALALGLCLV